MHPIERLRYVARASRAPQAVLVQETAAALASFCTDPQALVTACRRIVSRQPTSGPLLWLAARALSAGDPGNEIWEAAGAVQSDETAAVLARALADDAVVTVLGWPDEAASALLRRGDCRVRVIDVLNEGPALVQRLWQAGSDAADVPLSGLGAAVADSDLLLLEASAVGPDEFLTVSGSLAAASVARQCSVDVWLVTGVGRLLPRRMWDGLRRRVDTGEPWDADHEIVPLTLVDHVAGPWGVVPVADALRRCDCPVVPELFRGE